ncbi:MAG: hypothetical protein IJ220_07160 [Clostridia bacterium]|nr:hypothetical protein [Clostridia bacterium]
MKNFKEFFDSKKKKVVLEVILIILILILLVLVYFILNKEKFKSESTPVVDETGKIDEASEFVTILDTDRPDYYLASGEKIVENNSNDIEKYELITEKIKVSKFEIKEENEHKSLVAFVENTSDEKIENISLLVKLFNANDEMIQDFVTLIPSIEAGMESSFEVNLFDIENEITKVDVEMYDDEKVMKEVSYSGES